MSIDSLSQISTGATALTSVLLAIPQLIGGGSRAANTIGYQPQNKPTIENDTSSLSDAFLFDYEGEQIVNLTSDITDHYIEDNSSIQDMITLKPETITTQGYIGELNDIPGTGLKTLKKLSDKLVTISGFGPNFSASAVSAFNDAKFAYDIAVNTGGAFVDTWSTITGKGGSAVINGQNITNTNISTQSKQQKAFQKFYSYWKLRTLFTIQTPWAVFQDMAIQSLRAIQDAETESISNFEITFKLMRFAKAQTTSTNNSFLNNLQGRALQQASFATIKEQTLSPGIPLQAELG